MTENMQKERRKFIRLVTTIDIKYKILKMGKRGEAVSKDISGEGIGLSVSEKIPTASILLLEMKIPVYPESIIAKGIVVWSKKSESEIKKFEIGVKFIKINPIVKTRIFKYIYELIY